MTSTPPDELAAREIAKRLRFWRDTVKGSGFVGLAGDLEQCAAFIERPAAQRVEPRGCPTPGACSCVEPSFAATEEMVERAAEAAHESQRAELPGIEAWENFKKHAPRNAEWYRQLARAALTAALSSAPDDGGKT